jgi:hypothetical protein
MEASIHSQINNTDFWGRLHAVSRFGGEAHNPGSRVINVNLGITGVYGGECNAVPSTQLDEILDGCNSNLRSYISTIPTSRRKERRPRTPSMAGCREKKTTRPVGARAIYV